MSDPETPDPSPSPWRRGSAEEMAGFDEIRRRTELDTRASRDPAGRPVSREPPVRRVPPGESTSEQDRQEEPPQEEDPSSAPTYSSEQDAPTRVTAPGEDWSSQMLRRLELGLPAMRERILHQVARPQLPPPAEASYAPTVPVHRPSPPRPPTPAPWPEVVEMDRCVLFLLVALALLGGIGLGSLVLGAVLLYRIPA